MAKNFLSLDDAAERLGISHEELVELRSRGEIRGFRDGATWKFDEQSINDYLSEQQEEGGWDAALGGGGKLGSILDGDEEVASSESDAKADSDVGLGDEPLMLDSDVLSLADDIAEGSTNPGLGSKSSEKPSSKIESELTLESEPTIGHTSSLEMLGDELELAGGDDAGKSGASGLDVLSELDLLSSPGGSGTGDVIRGDSDPKVLGGSEIVVGSDIASGSDLLSGSGVSGSSLDFDDAVDDDDELVIADDDDDLLIGGPMGSDISIAGDSGMNLMSPSDSGISLEGEPLDLAGSSISALDLGAELDGSGVGSSQSGGGSGSLVDFEAGEDFQLSPSGIDIEVDDDSGSQVIEVEESTAFGSGIDFVEGDAFAEAEEDPFGGDPLAAGVVDEGGFDTAVEAEPEDALGIDPNAAVTSAAAGGVPAPTYEVPFSLMSVLSLAAVVLLMCFAGMIGTDLIRNLWSYNEMSTPVTSLTDALIDMFGFGP